MQKRPIFLPENQNFGDYERGLIPPIFMHPFTAYVRLFPGLVPADGFAPSPFTLPIAAILAIVAIVPVIVVIIAVTSYASQHPKQQRSAKQKQYSTLHVMISFLEVPCRKHTRQSLNGNIPGEALQEKYTIFYNKYGHEIIYPKEVSASGADFIAHDVRHLPR